MVIDKKSVILGVLIGSLSFVFAFRLASIPTPNSTLPICARGVNDY